MVSNCDARCTVTTQESYNVLDYWHSVEFFNGYDLDEKLDEAHSRSRHTVCIRSDDTGPATWSSVAKRPGELYLVPFDASVATLLIEQYVASRTPQPSPVCQAGDAEMALEGSTCFAKLTLEGDGRINIDSFSVSALPWALGRLQSGELDDLRATAFEASVKGLREDMAALACVETDEPISYETLSRMVEHLRGWAGFSPDDERLAWMVESPMHGGQRGRNELSDDDASTTSSPDDTDTEDNAATNGDEEKDIPILNSFYVHDLKQARRELAGAHPPRALVAYLAGTDRPKLDLDAAPGQHEILTALRPRNGIAGRWPSSPKHAQSLMQQYALNKMRAMRPGEILAVNGPPGTGKTTLLRDLIAHLLVERATILASFDSWKEGLASSEEKIVFSNATYNIPVLSPRLVGFEIVVASTNNGAVENLSLELPQRKHIDSVWADTLEYFRPVATRYAGTHPSKPWKPPAEPVWGLISAALGKRANRTRFSDVFGYRAAQPQDRPGMFLAKHKVKFDSWDVVGAMTYWRYREQTSGTRVNFQAAKQRFQQARAAYDAEHAWLDRLDEKLRALQTSWARAKHLYPDLPRLDMGDVTLNGRITRFAERLSEEVRLIESRLMPPFLRWLSRWFQRDLYQRWCDVSEAAFLVRGVREDLDKVRTQIERMGVTVWDGGDLRSTENQSRAFWQSEALSALRNELFAAAMGLHEAFFHEVHSHDLGVALSKLVSKPPEAGAKALWQWFFMLTPVVSSTFASFRRQFSGLGPQDLGWLVIDEAGQAVPQAAVGAIMRAQRVVVVGDPLQIPPVVTQSTRLLERLGEYWLQHRRTRYAVNNHSVQTLADRCYPFGVRHPIEREKFIGIPLVMHRRCDNPMFEISNAIAYDGRMKHAKESVEAPHPVLGHSAWWHMKGTGNNGRKYVDDQGRRVLDALAELYRSRADGVSAELPDVFVITPFRDVKRGLVDLLSDRDQWDRLLMGTGISAPTNLADWVKKRVGTVHTFQGKESDVVFFVLGCGPEHAGAVDWASAEPNLLNVAVTRAKQYFYIVGDSELWGRKQYFETAFAMTGGKSGGVAL